MPSSYLVGLDVGQMVDFSALAVLEREEGEPEADVTMVYNRWRRNHYVVPADPGPATYHVRHLHRYPLGTSYVIMAEEVAALCQKPELGENPTVLVDVTGVGRGIGDILEDADISPYSVTLHGGYAYTRKGHELHVPKRDLVMSTTRLLMARPIRLTLSMDVPFASAVLHELRSFTAKTDPATSHESYAAWREQDHDDLVIAVAVCAWWGEHQYMYRAGTWGRSF